MALADSVHRQDFDACPDCGAPLVLRMAGGDGTQRHRFWGCSTYPVTGCLGSRTFEGSPIEAYPGRPRVVRRRDRGQERSMTTVALAAVIERDDILAADGRSGAPEPMTDARSARAAAARRAATARVGREYHRQVDARVARVGDRWPLMLMAYVGFAGGAVLATAWIHPAIAGVALMAMTALFIEALLRPSRPTPSDDADHRHASAISDQLH
jgi:hypothetical protein